MARTIHHGGCDHFPDGVCVESSDGITRHLSDAELAAMTDEEASSWFTDVAGESVTIENASEPTTRVVRTP